MAQLPTTAVPSQPRIDLSTLGLSDKLLQRSVSYADIKRMNVLLVGPTGTGKTVMAVATSPRPVYYAGFDRGGSVHISNHVDEGWLLRDANYENDDPWNPTAWNEFVSVYDQMVAKKVFYKFGTQVIDSLTGLTKAAMNKVLGDAGRHGQVPSGKGYSESDYSKAQSLVENLLYKILSQPCTTILTAHIDTQTDKITEEITRSILVTGRLKAAIPAMFNEVWYMLPQHAGGKVQWRVATMGDGRAVIARSMLAYRGKLDMYEPAHISNIFKKAGMRIPDFVTEEWYKPISAEINDLKKPVQPNK